MRTSTSADYEASLIEISGSQPEPITITVDADLCRWRIDGALSGPDDLPLAGIEIRAKTEDSSTSVRTELDGSFSFLATEPGSYQLSADLGGCRLYWNADDPTWTEEHAGAIDVVNRDVTDIQLRAEVVSVHQDDGMATRSEWRRHQERPDQRRCGSAIAPTIARIQRVGSASR